MIHGGQSLRLHSFSFAGTSCILQDFSEFANDIFSVSHLMPSVAQGLIHQVRSLWLSQWALALWQPKHLFWTSVPSNQCPLYPLLKASHPSWQNKVWTEGWVIPLAVTHEHHTSLSKQEALSSCCSPGPEHNKNSPFVVLRIFCWAQLIPAFCLPDTSIRGWTIFHLRIKAFPKADDFKGAS